MYRTVTHFVVVVVYVCVHTDMIKAYIIDYCLSKLFL